MKETPDPLGYAGSLSTYALYTICEATVVRANRSCGVAYST